MQGLQVFRSHEETMENLSNLHMTILLSHYPLIFSCLCFLTGYADKAGRQPLQQHRTTGQEGALLTRSNISEVPAFDSSSPAGIRPSQRAPSPRMASPEGQNVYRGSYSNNCRPLDNLEGPPFQQHYSSQQGASWTAPNNCHEPGLGFPSTSSMPAQRAGYNEGQNVIRNSPTSRHTPSNSPSTRSIPFGK